MLHCSQEAYLLCDQTKFDKVGYASTAKAQDISVLITDTKLEPSYEKNIHALGIKTILAG